MAVPPREQQRCVRSTHLRKRRVSKTIDFRITTNNSQRERHIRNQPRTNTACLTGDPPQNLLAPLSQQILPGPPSLSPFFIFFNIAVMSASFFVTTASGAKVTKDLLFRGSSWNLWLYLFPIIFISIFGTIPSPSKIENFRIGRFRIKIVMLIYSSVTLFIGAIVRLIAAAQTHPINAPGQVDSKPIFYLTGFFLEILVVILFAAARFGLLFHIPDGCTGPGQYAPKKEADEEELFQDVDVKMRLSYGL